MNEAKKIFQLVHVEMEPGDALFFHCNLLHSSNQNHSEFRRWVMITSYNKKSNNPVYKHLCPFYHPLNIVANQEILACDPNARSTIDKDVIDQSDDEIARKKFEIGQ